MKNGRKNHMHSRRQPPSRSILKKKWLCVIAALMVLSLLLGIAFACWFYSGDETMRPERSAVKGNMPGKTQEQLEAEKNRTIDTDTIAFSLNSNPEFSDGKSKGFIQFENPDGNGKLTRLEIYRNDTGDLIYHTGILKPGSYVEEDVLDAELPQGEYDCTAQIYAYGMRQKDYIGKITIGVMVRVKQ